MTHTGAGPRSQVPEVADQAQRSAWLQAALVQARPAPVLGE